MTGVEQLYTFNYKVLQIHREKQKALLFNSNVSLDICVVLDHPQTAQDNKIIAVR